MELGEENFKKLKLSNPIAAVSIAQVHFAEIILENNQTKKVAVKVLRPNIEKILIKNLKL